MWNLDEMAYVETLFGHADVISDIDSLSAERAVSVGVDRTVRLWKVLEETQLVFHGHSAPIDCVRMLTPSSFLTGSQDGAQRPRCLRARPRPAGPRAHRGARKRPGLMRAPPARRPARSPPYRLHRLAEPLARHAQEARRHRAARARLERAGRRGQRGGRRLVQLDQCDRRRPELRPRAHRLGRRAPALLASRRAGQRARAGLLYPGARCAQAPRARAAARAARAAPRAPHAPSPAPPFLPLAASGFINAIAVAQKSRRFAVVATAQEHRLGRWFNAPSGRNGIAVVPLPAEVQA